MHLLAECLGLHVTPTLFRIMVLMRLGMPIAAADSACLLCDATNYHSEWVTIRGCALVPSATTGCVPSLLPEPRQWASALKMRNQGWPEDGGATAVAAGHRPVDVWVPQWSLHGAAAFDLAVTSTSGHHHRGQPLRVRLRGAEACLPAH